MRADILTMSVDVTTSEAVVGEIIARASEGRSTTVCVSNVHMCMYTWDHAGFRAAVNSANFVVADGRPIYWAQRLLGHAEARQVRGYDLTRLALQRAAAAGLPVGFYGSTPEVLERMLTIMLQEIPGLRVAYRHSPPFRVLTEEENAEQLKQIVNSGCRLLFLGLGCPKQERWMEAHRHRLPLVMLGVGAAFDFIAGTKRKAPCCLQKLGLEWAFRLACEPRRLFWRYTWHNPRFIVLLTLQLLRQRLASSRRPAAND